MKLSDLQRGGQLPTKTPGYQEVCHCGHTHEQHSPGNITGSDGKLYYRSTLCLICGGKVCDEYEFGGLMETAK